MLASDAVHLSRFWKIDQTDPGPHLCDSTFRCQPHPANAKLLWALQRVVVIRGNTVGRGHCLSWEALERDDASLSAASLVCRSSLNRTRVSISCRRKVSGVRQSCQADLLGQPADVLAAAPDCAPVEPQAFWQVRAASLESQAKRPSSFARGALS